MTMKLLDYARPLADEPTVRVPVVFVPPALTGDPARQACEIMAVTHETPEAMLKRLILQEHCVLTMRDTALVHIHWAMKEAEL